MARWNVMVSAPYMQGCLDRFRDVFRERDAHLIAPPVRERLEEDELLRLVPDLDGVICGDDRFTERVLAAAPRLKVISKWGTGIDSIDLDACRRHGVTVCNTPNAFTAPVADSAMGYILAFARRQPWMNAMMHAGRWEKIPGRALNECVLGILGVGNIGKALARRAQPFGMTLLGHDIVDMPADFLRETGLHMVPRDELFTRADFLSIHCSLNPSSRHLVDEAAFALMRPECVVINTARGPIVDEAALIRALQAGRLAGAGLDVFEHEPLPADSPLLTMDNVLMAPHNANSSPTAWERVHQNTIHNLFAELERRNP